MFTRCHDCPTDLATPLPSALVSPRRSDAGQGEHGGPIPRVAFSDSADFAGPRSGIDKSFRLAQQGYSDNVGNDAQQR